MNMKIVNSLINSMLVAAFLFYGSIEGIICNEPNNKDRDALRPMSALVQSGNRFIGFSDRQQACEDGILGIGEKTYLSPFKRQANEKLSSLITYWVGILGIDPSILELDFPDNRDQIELMESVLSDLSDDDYDSSRARNIIKRILILNIYQKLLEVYTETGTIPVVSPELMGLVYSPGVGWCCSRLAKDLGQIAHYVKTDSYQYRYTGGVLEQLNPAADSETGINMYVVTDGSATLGIGNIGEASVPVMFGKMVLLELFGSRSVKAGICYVDNQQAWRDKNHDAIIENVISACRAIRDKNQNAVIMLEDIAAPLCFEIQKRLNEEGVFALHDDQWGTAIVFVAGVIKALEITQKDPRDCKIIISGAGASGIAVTRLLSRFGINEIIVYDSKGAIYNGRDHLTPEKREIAALNKEEFSGTIEDALLEADGFIGLSEPGLFHGKEVEMLRHMAERSFVFAGANPDPEFNLDIIYEHNKGELRNIEFYGGGAFGGHWSTLNNSSAFPGLYKAITDAVNEGRLLPAEEIDIIELVLNCAQGLALTYGQQEKGAEEVVPPTFLEAGYNFMLTANIAAAAWPVLTGETTQQAQARYGHLHLQLAEEQSQMLEKLESLSINTKSFIRGLIQLLDRQDTPVIRQLLAGINADPVPQTAPMSDLSHIYIAINSAA
jgi:malic enzyme